MSVAVAGAGMALTGVADVVKSLYGAAAAAKEFLDRHIAELKKSDQPALATTGRVLEGARAGFGVGYAGCLAVVVVGQLMLGNPFTAGTSFVMAAVGLNPVAISCGAIGAIYYGWRALSDAERDAIIDRVVQVMGIAHDTIRAIVHFVLNTTRQLRDSRPLLDLKNYLVTQAEAWGHTVGEVTRTVADKAGDLLRSRPDPLLIGTGNTELLPVLHEMQRSELEAVLEYPFRVKAPADADEERLREMLRIEIVKAGSSSLPGTRPTHYGEILVMVARHLKIPVPVAADAATLEHFVLFKVLERSIEKMDEEEKLKFLACVQSDLHARGIRGNVTLEQVTAFVKVAGMDIGGTVGALAFAAPGLAGMAGLNVLQLIVLKGIVVTSGYMVAIPSLFGFGMGGALMTVSAAAGPISAALGVLYGIYKLSGPAYRKMVPAVCAIAAKRIEIASRAAAPVLIPVQTAAREAKAQRSRKSCSICGHSLPLAEFNYGKRENRSYCRECSRREKQAYSRGGAVEARSFRDGMRSTWKT